MGQDVTVRFAELSKAPADCVKDNILKQSRQKVVDYYRREEVGAFDEDGVLNIGVSYDGTWAKRGHTSKIGAGAVIEIMTGLVIAFHIMSLYCQSYYTKAVRSFNLSTEEMSKAIWASFFHSISTKELPVHQYCPAGEECWCWYQRALLTGPVDPAFHDRQQSTFLNSDVANYVGKVYKRLTDSSLLSRCLLGKTQNCNESLHSVIYMG
ncbi:hypothetical protein PoB_000911600 [Plakobranchus ocellatus]|uniref:Mutator-like transposase domain-containing protein n=1 Tax=Plakobranchus ocellatus TaxID=259542 RepID=A0AAV3Y5S5_9GAST|nr:hypothetical protein PoB_000911600 [Plakobranchus ocellatus]